MRSSQPRIVALALGLLLAAAASTHAVVIYFKDGSKEVVAESYRIDGDRLIAILQSGQETSIPLAAVDLERTEATGNMARGSAIVLDTVNPSGQVRAPDADRTLRELMRDKAAIKPPAAATDGGSRSARRTPAGNVDLLAVPRRPISPSARAEVIAALIERKGLRKAEAYQGTTANRVLIDIATASRGEVFSALETCAAVLVELRASMPEIEALELAMATTSRSRAGQFVLTPEEAQRLQSGAVTPAEHFVANVLF
jgi:hypothetical protein